LNEPLPERPELFLGSLGRGPVALHGSGMDEFFKGLEETTPFRLRPIFVSMGSAGPNTNKTRSNRHL
jgi:hypothetical protein